MEHMEAIINEIDSRVKNIRIYHPFFTFYNEGSKIDGFDMPVLMLATLSFLMYEGRLKSKSVSFSQIRDFLMNFLLTAYNYELGEEDYMKFTREVIERLDGSYTYTYIKPITNQVSRMNTVLVTQDAKTFEFTITKDGLDFLLKTKEFGDEAQISINLLLFKKQIESGSFSYAYEIVKRLNIEVQKRIEEKSVILNIVLNGGTQGSEEYKRYWDRISNQFSEEEGIFRDTVHFLKDFYSNEVDRRKMSDKDAESLKDLTKIELELIRAQNLHTKLIDEVLNMSNDYENILNIKMQSAFTDKFEFEKMIDKSCNVVNDLRVLSAILNPMYTTNKRKRFSLEKVFEPQRVSNAEERIAEDYETGEIVNIETVDMKTIKRIEHNYFYYVKILMYTLLRKYSLTLNELVKILFDAQSENYLFNVDFVPFLSRINHIGREKLIAHLKVISLKDLLMKDEKLQNDIEKCIYRVLISDERFKEYHKIIIETIPDDEVVINEIIKVTNMRFLLE